MSHRTENDYHRLVSTGGCTSFYWTVIMQGFSDILPHSDTECDKVDNVQCANWKPHKRRHSLQALVEWSYHTNIRLPLGFPLDRGRTFQWLDRSDALSGHIRVHWSDDNISDLGYPHILLRCKKFWNGKCIRGHNQQITLRGCCFVIRIYLIRC